MTRSAVRIPGDGSARRSARSRLPLILLCLLSLTVQAYLTQTHFHPAPERPVAGQQAPGGGKQPVGDAGHCFLCHQAAAAGAYLTAAPVLHVMPRAVLAFVPVIAETPFALRALSHGWRGRGPPRF